MINYIENENVFRHLRKKNKDWSEEKIKMEAKRMWGEYLEDNRERIEKEQQLNEKSFNESIDKEFRQIWFDSLSL